MSDSAPETVSYPDREARDEKDPEAYENRKDRINKETQVSRRVGVGRTA